MNRHFIIDGYNLIHRVRDLSTGAEDLQEQRERLIHKLVAFSARRKVAFRVVFDSAAGCRRSESHPGVRVDYVSPNADTFIRNIISSNADNRDLVIVSSDRKDIGDFARISGLSWMTSEEFWEQVNSFPKRITDHKREDGEEPPDAWSERDDDWLRDAFGG